MECPRCSADLDSNTEFIETPELKHYGKEVCGGCGAWLRWVAKPENLGTRTRTSKFSVKHFPAEVCEIYRRPRSMLGNNESLEIHHRDINPENDTMENLLLLCTCCHRQVHHNHVYLYLRYRR